MGICYDTEIYALGIGVTRVSDCYIHTYMVRPRSIRIPRSRERPVIVRHPFKIEQICKSHAIIVGLPLFPVTRVHSAM